MSRDRSRPRPAPAAIALPPGALDGPKRAAAALAVFFAASMLAVHLAYRDAGPARVALADAPAASAPEPPPPAPARAPAAEAAVAQAEPPLSLGVAPVPAPPPSAAREREVAACVERAIQASGAGVPRTTAPGRWPALKRAREELRQKRLAARADCERTATL